MLNKQKQTPILSVYFCVLRTKLMKTQDSSTCIKELQPYSEIKVLQASGVFAEKLSIQVDELSEETPVGYDAPVVFHGTDGLHQGEVLLQHQVGQDQGGRAAHPHVAVHQHSAWVRQGDTSGRRDAPPHQHSSSSPPLTSSAESRVNKVSRCPKVDAHVKVAGVTSVDAHVGDVHGGGGVRPSSAFTVSGVQDVSDSMKG